MGSYLADAIGAIPQVTDVRQARERLRQHIARRGDVPTRLPGLNVDGEHRMRRTFSESVLRGGKLPSFAELSAEVAAVRGFDVLAAQSAAALMDDALRSLDDVEARTVAQHVDVALRWLDTALVELLDVARTPAVALGDVRIAAGQVEADDRATANAIESVQLGTVGRSLVGRQGRWITREQASDQVRGLWDTLAVHATAYRELRAAQSNLVRRVLRDQAAADLKLAGEFRDLPSVWPDWRVLPDRKTGKTRKQADPPWGNSVETGDRAQCAFLAWVAAVDARVLWVPTIAELRETADRVRTGGAPPVDMLAAHGHDHMAAALRGQILRAGSAGDAPHGVRVTTGSIPTDF